MWDDLNQLASRRTNNITFVAAIIDAHLAAAPCEQCAQLTATLEARATEEIKMLAEVEAHATAEAFAQAAEVAQKQAGKNRTIGDTKAIAEKILALSPDPDYSARIRNEAPESACSALLNDIEESESRLRQGGLTLDQRNDLLDRQSHATAFIAIIRARKRKEGDTANA